MVSHHVNSVFFISVLFRNWTGTMKETLWECNIGRIHPWLSSSAKIEQLHACSHNSVTTHILDLHAWHQSLLTDHNNLWVIMEKLVVKPLSWKKVIQSNCTGTVCATWSTFHHRYYYTMISPSHNHPAGSTLKKKKDNLACNRNNQQFHYKHHVSSWFIFYEKKEYVQRYHKCINKCQN